jgi:hypothetical protein
MFKKVNVSVIAIIIVIVAITASVITWLFTEKIQAPVQQNTTMTSASVVQPTTSTTQPAVQSMPTDEIVNWKTYSNSKYGFEFKYPDYLKPESVNDNLLTISNRKRKGGNLENGDIVLTFEISKKADEMGGLDEKLKQTKEIEKSGGAVISRYKEMNIDGFPAIQQLEDVKVSDPGCYWSTYINKSDRYDSITLMSAKCDTIINLENDYNKILSTFKFIKS